MSCAAPANQDSTSIWSNPSTRMRCWICCRRFRRAPRSRMKREFLRAPVQQFSDIDFILRRARDRMDPAEFLQGLACAAEPSQELAVERQFVNAARVAVRHV